MRKKENQDYDVTPIPWWAIIFLIVFFGLLWLSLFLVENPDSETEFLLIFAPFGVAWIVTDFGRNYVLTRESITCRMFFIPYRKILWEDVIQAGIALCGTGRYVDTYLILTLKGCPQYELVTVSCFLFCHVSKNLRVYASAHLSLCWPGVAFTNG